LAPSGLASGDGSAARCSGSCPTVEPVTEAFGDTTMAEHGLKGTSLTFDTLTASKLAGVSAVLVEALNEPDEVVQVAAVKAAIKRRDRRVLLAVLRNLGSATERIRKVIFDNAADLFGVLKVAVVDESRNTRLNVLEVLEALSEPMITSLLVPALNDADEEVRREAGILLRRVVDDFHALAGDFEKGLLQIDRYDLEAKKYAILDPLLAGLRNVNQKNKEVIIALLPGLDGRGDDVLIDILKGRFDERARMITDLLWRSTDDAVVGFLVEVLKNDDVAGLAVSIVEKRDDMPFLRALGSQDELFNDRYALERLTHIREPAWIDYPVDEFKDFTTRQFVNIVSLVVLSNVPGDKKMAFLKRCYANENPALKQFIAEVLKGLETGADPLAVVPGLRFKAIESSDVAKDGMAETEGELPVVAGAPVMRQFDNLLATFSVGSAAKAKQELLVLKRAGLNVERQLRRALNSIMPEKRLHAIQLIDVCELARQFDSDLLNMLFDRSEKVRASAVKVLAGLRDTASIRALLKAACDMDKRVMANTIEAAEIVGIKELTTLIRPFLDYPDNRIRANAIKALWSMRDRSGLLALQKMITSQSTEDRLSAVWLLGHVEIPRRTDILKKIAAKDRSQRVRDKAAETAAKLEAQVHVA